MPVKVRFVDTVVQFSIRPEASPKSVDIIQLDCFEFCRKLIDITFYEEWTFFPVEPSFKLASTQILPASLQALLETLFATFQKYRLNLNFHLKPFREAYLHLKDF